MPHFWREMKKAGVSHAGPFRESPYRRRHSADRFSLSFDSASLSI